MKNKKVLFIIIAVLLILAAIFFCYAIFNQGDKKESKDEIASKLADDFYEYYYAKLGTDEARRNQALETYVNTGIKISLKNLANTDEETKTIINDNFADCDQEKSQIIIYPKEPYGQKDYEKDYALVCEE